ncbi:AimR family lysis-lysogeny pheromone receptor [Halobacillus seohaensis]|uniref:AimR family lysis-lysogeny pheromone receptor n=1 Tax=Halobacillus seohaensis TaxID=447421 RepID=A0ABW2EI99_9BACI
MGTHNIIEPAQLLQLQMNHVSTIYETYHSLLQNHPKEKANELTKHYCMNYFPKTVDEQLAVLEFLYMNDHFKELKKILRSHDFLEEVTFLYKILLNRLEKHFSIKDILSIESLEFKHPSLKCLHVYTIIYLYYDLKKYTGLDKFIDQCYLKLSDVREPLFHYYMKIRFNELTFHHYWKTNSIILAKKYAYKVLNMSLSPRKLSAVHHNLALCYVFEGFTPAFDNAQIALDIAKKHNFHSMISSLEHHTIPFICAFHHQTNAISTPDPIETAHLAIANKQINKAVEILSSLKTLTPFQECYLGVATENKKLLHQSERRFIDEYGDHFFAMLPKYYLERLK